jgi:hypothetical protein
MDVKANRKCEKEFHMSLTRLPDSITITNKSKSIQLKRLQSDNSITLFGLNPKCLYQDEESNQYIAKIEKQRSLKDRFTPAITPCLWKTASEENRTTPIFDEKRAELLYTNHHLQLQDANAITAVIASNVARHIFADILRVPLNFITRVNNQSVIFSKKNPDEEHFNEIIT